ncbi:MAG: ATP-binding protein [Ruminococcus flavefaciens]|nr:ATP-binding protein [Ruminococcus flavefaciens]MCM1060585.1 ATP-binding protein [Eubacterium sp.]
MSFNRIFDDLERKTAENVNTSDSDYIMDGLLHCGKCRTSKQVRIELFGKVRTPYCLCKCETEKRDAEIAELERQKGLQRIKELRKAGFSDTDMQNWTFENDDRTNPKVSEIAHKYVENFPKLKEKGKGLLFYGTVGAGKTFISACIANALIDKGHPCLVTNFARLTNTIGGMFDGKQDYIDSLNRFTLLVIDDLAAERDTEYMNEIVFNIIDSRYRSGLPLIITTNLTAQELNNPAQISKQRIYSRLLEMCIPVEIKGKDRRKTALRDGVEEYKSLLGL